MTTFGAVAVGTALVAIKDGSGQLVGLLFGLGAGGGGEGRGDDEQSRKDKPDPNHYVKHFLIANWAPASATGWR